MEKKKQPATVDEYVIQFPEEVQQVIGQIRGVIKGVAPEAVEKMSYGMPAYYLNGGLVWFGVWKQHIGFYPKTPDLEAAIPELKSYPGTHSSIHFPLKQPLPVSLIEKIVKQRIVENQKAQARGELPD